MSAFGRLAWPALLEPAIALAEEGVLLDWYGALAIAVAGPDLALFEPARRLFLPQGLAPLPGSGTTPHYLPPARLGPDVTAPGQRRGAGLL